MKVKAVSKCMAIPAQNPGESWCEACGTAAVPHLHWWEGSNYVQSYTEGKVQILPPRMEEHP